MVVTKEKARIYQEALNQWGMDSQINMAIEEMAELISVLQHYRRKKTWGHLATVEDIADEIADVEIMMEQLKFMFGIGSLQLFQIKEKKLNRVKKLLVQEQGGANDKVVG